MFFYLVSYICIWLGEITQLCYRLGVFLELGRTLLWLHRKLSLRRCTKHHCVSSSQNTRLMTICNFEYGVIYKIKTDKGYFTLGNKSASNLSDGSKPRWTIDVPKEILGLKNGKEIKFK
jgi:hypothetical protein